MTRNGNGAEDEIRTHECIAHWFSRPAPLSGLGYLGLSFLADDSPMQLNDLEFLLSFVECSF